MIDLAQWTGRLDALIPEYRLAEPFPHINIQGFLDSEAAHALEGEFPQRASEAWTQYKHFNENKTGLSKRDQIPRNLGLLIDEFNSPEFAAWLSELTGIPGLIPDPSLEGGGLHQSSRGGFLNVHADFTLHHHQPTWRRRVNVILYLNDGWQEEWGGAIELWDRKMTKCVKKVYPRLNHMLIFNTDEVSYHGFPDQMQCPEGVSRKSVALYYYTAETKMNARATLYKARPEDAARKAAMIWADNQALTIYSKIKQKLGISDAFATKVLSLFSKK